MKRISSSLIFLSLILAIVLPSGELTPTFASSAPSLVNSSQTRLSLPAPKGPPFKSFLPIVYQDAPDPILAYVQAVDLGHYTQQLTLITNEYGPRHPGYKANFIDDRCKLDLPNPDRKNNLVRALEYTVQYFQNLGYTIQTESTNSEYGYNVVAIKTGAVYPNVYLEVGAHIDNHTDTPGASDNSSGVAGVFEIANVLKNYSSRYTLRFVIYVAEEYGMKGSILHTQLALNRGDIIKMALVMDAIGWSEIAPLHMNCIFANPAIPATEAAAEKFNQARQKYGIDIGWRLCGDIGGPNSDNLQYWNRSYPAVLSIGGLPYTTPTYHQCNDAMTTVDILNGYKTTQENLAVLLMLDGEPVNSTELSAPPVQPEIPTGPVISH